jgi:hypothetical protein
MRLPRPTPVIGTAWSSVTAVVMTTTTRPSDPATWRSRIRRQTTSAKRRWRQATRAARASSTSTTATTTIRSGVTISRRVRVGTWQPVCRSLLPGAPVGR